MSCVVCPSSVPPGTPDLAGVEVVTGEHPQAVALCRLVLERSRQGSDHEPPIPLYLRRPDVSPAGPQKSVLP